jgi:hypothetical protein
MLCEYRNALGKPGEGFHKDRLFGLAANDLIGTVILIIVIAVLSGWNVIMVGMVVTVLTVIVHRVFCVNTELNKKIFGNV